MIVKPEAMTFADKKIRMLIAGFPGIGKALDNRTDVLTEDGWKAIWKLTTNDRVYGEDGILHDVLGVYPQGLRPTYDVKFSDGSVIRCDENHIWTVCATAGNSAKLGWRNLTTKELIDRGIHCDSPSRKASNRKPILRWKVPIAEPFAGARLDFVIHPYLMGVLLGDGCTSGGKPIFVCPESDSEIVDRIKVILGNEYQLSMRMISLPNYYIKHVGSATNPIAQAIRAFGLDTVAGNKHIPVGYMTASYEQRLDLLRGLMDTDGSAHKNRVTFCTTSPELASNVVSLVQSLGGLAKCHRYDRSDEEKTTEYHVQIRLNRCPFYLKRKAAEWSPTTYSRRIESITKAADGECTCIMVDNPTGLFVTENYIVTHNTTLALSAPKPLYIDVDLSAERINREVLNMAAGVTQPRDYAELRRDLGIGASDMELMNVKSDLKDFETIVIDTGGKLLTIMGQYGQKIEPKYGQRDGSLSLKGYGWLGKEFQRFLDHCIYNLDKHIVIIFHTVEEKDGDDTKLRIKAEGSSRNNVWEVMDLGGFMEMRGKARTIGFDNCERYFAKGTRGIHGVWTIPELTPGTPNNFLAKLFEEYNAKSADEAKQATIDKADYESAMLLGQQIIGSITDADTANAAMPRFKQIKHALTSEKELTAAWNKKIKDLDLFFDKVIKAYTPAPPKEAE